MTERPTPDTRPTESTRSAAAPEQALAARVAGLTDRRDLLKVAGVVVGAGALAACSSPPVPSGGGSAGGGSGASGGGTAGIPTSEIPVGGGKVFADAQTVVTQPTAGTFKAFDAICPHQGCTVGSVEGGQIICPCHQSHFDDRTGAVVSGPAPTGLTPKTVKVSGSTLTVS